MGTRNNEVCALFDLLFVDDTFVFCKSSQEHIHRLRNLFLCFEVVSRLEINLNTGWSSG